MGRRVVHQKSPAVKHHKLLHKLAKDSFCRLDVVPESDTQANQLRGLRVVAIRDIPASKALFRGERMRTVEIPAHLINNLPERVAQTVRDASVPDLWGVYTVPEFGLDDVNLSFFVRHSGAGANLEPVDTTPGETTYHEYVTSREIRAGEELMAPGCKRPNGNFSSGCNEDELQREAHVKMEGRWSSALGPSVWPPKADWRLEGTWCSTESVGSAAESFSYLTYGTLKVAAPQGPTSRFEHYVYGSFMNNGAEEYEKVLELWSAQSPTSARIELEGSGYNDSVGRFFFRGFAEPSSAGSGFDVTLFKREVGAREQEDRALHRLKLTKARLQRTTDHGVGLFSIQKIKAGENIFEQERPLTSTDITAAELATLPLSVQTLVKDYFVPTEAGAYPVLHTGLNDLNITFYLNHSDSPNIKLDSDGESDYAPFVALRDIAVGEELTYTYPPSHWWVQEQRAEAAEAERIRQAATAKAVRLAEEERNRRAVAAKAERLAEEERIRQAAAAKAEQLAEIERIRQAAATKAERLAEEERIRRAAVERSRKEAEQQRAVLRAQHREAQEKKERDTAGKVARWQIDMHLVPSSSRPPPPTLVFDWPASQRLQFLNTVNHLFSPWRKSMLASECRRYLQHDQRLLRQIFASIDIIYIPPGHVFTSTASMDDPLGEFKDFRDG